MFHFSILHFCGHKITGVVAVLLILRNAARVVGHPYLASSHPATINQEHSRFVPRQVPAAQNHMSSD